MNFIIRLLITAVVAYGLTRLLSGIHLEDFKNALIFALVLSLLNTFVKPVLKLIGLPLTIITLGFFSLVINTLIVMLAAKFIEGMKIDGFWWAFIFALALSLITSLLNGIFISQKEK